MTLFANGFTDNATAWSTVVLAVVTVVLAYFGFRQVGLTRQALGQASSDNQEAIKARIDQRAPLVVVLVAGVGPATKYWISNSNEGPKELANGDELLEDHHPIGLTGWLWVYNYGRSTGVVTVPPGVIPVGDQRGIPPFSDLKVQRPTQPSDFSLSPGEGQMLFVQVAMTASEWKNNSRLDSAMRAPLTAEITVADTFYEGVVDTTVVSFYGMPITQIPRAEQLIWVGGAVEPTRFTVGRTVRRYPNLNPISPSGRWWRKIWRSEESMPPTNQADEGYYGSRRQRRMFPK